MEDTLFRLPRGRAWESHFLMLDYLSTLVVEIEELQEVEDREIEFFISCSPEEMLESSKRICNLQTAREKLGESFFHAEKLAWISNNN